MTDRLLTPEDLAEMLSVTPTWAKRAARESLIPCIYVGRYPRFRRESILAWMAEQEKEPTRSAEFRKHNPKLKGGASA